MSEEKLPGEGETKMMIRVRRRCSCCDSPATYKNTYLDDRNGGARRNPASKAYGRDDCSWCSDFDDFLCSECHSANKSDNVPEGFGWCSTFEASRFPHMFLTWEDKATGAR